jgi:hypothetical protein
VVIARQRHQVGRHTPARQHRLPKGGVVGRQHLGGRRGNDVAHGRLASRLGQRPQQEDRAGVEQQATEVAAIGIERDLGAGHLGDRAHGQPARHREAPDLLVQRAQLGGADRVAVAQRQGLGDGVNHARPDARDGDAQVFGLFLGGEEAAIREAHDGGGQARIALEQVQDLVDGGRAGAVGGIEIARATVQVGERPGDAGHRHLLRLQALEQLLPGGVEARWARGRAARRGLG